MIVTAQIKFKHVLKSLGVEAIPGCDDGPDDWIEFSDCVDVDDYDLPDCDLCGGEGLPEPDDHAVNDWLIKDFIWAIQSGDIRTAQCLVGRVFELAHDVGVVEQSLPRLAA